MAVESYGNKSFFRKLKGNKNAYAMLLCEPLWGIPYYLFMPYFSLYMNDLGCTPEQIGLINTVGMAFQVVFALLAAPITDRLGRKKTTLIFDLISWSGAVLIWYFTSSFYGFLAAAIVQSIGRVVGVSWVCLMVEDTDKGLLVNIFSWLTIAGLLVGLFSPFAAIFVHQYHVVPTLRVLLLIAFVMMTGMFILRNALIKETSVGVMRREKSKSEPFLSRVFTLLKVIGDIWRMKKTFLFFALSAIYNAALVVKAPFFALLLTGALHFSEDAAGIFAAVSSLVMLAIYLFAQPLLRMAMPKLPLAAGLTLCAVGSVALIPTFGSWWGNLAAVIVSVVLTAAGTAVAQPYIDGISHGSMDNDKRSNMTSILMIFIMVVSTPFGWIGGALYTLNTRLPFLASTVLFIICAVLMLTVFKNEIHESTAETVA